MTYNTHTGESPEVIDALAIGRNAEPVITPNPETAVARAERLATAIADGLECPRCHSRMRIQSGGIFLPQPYCDNCHSGVVPTDEWKEAMRALGKEPVF